MEGEGKKWKGREHPSSNSCFRPLHTGDVKMNGRTNRITAPSGGGGVKSKHIDMNSNIAKSLILLLMRTWCQLQT